MRISSINSYNYASFTARKSQGKYSKNEASKPQMSETAKKIGALGLAGTVLLGGGLTIKSCQSNSATPEETQPTSAYVSTVPTEQVDKDDLVPLETQSRPVISYEPIISTRPISQRTPEYHTVVGGDRLADIVKRYAELDKDTPDEKLKPYYELLEADNPNAWSDRNIIYKGLKIRVDSILPENIIITYPDTTGETKPEGPTDGQEGPTGSTLPPQRPTSPADTVVLNGIEFNFDVGTMHKDFGDYSGLVDGKYVNLDKKLIGSGLIETRYVGTDSSSNRIEQITYDKNGKITERIVYDDENNVATKHEYEYTMTTRIETITDANAQSGQINKEKVTYEIGDDFVISKEFYVGNTLAATFNFDNDTVKFASQEPFYLDEGTFIYDADAIGSQRYYGSFNGQVVRFDVLKNGFCFEYLDANGDIEARFQYDAKGNLIYTEER